MATDTVAKELSDFFIDFPKGIIKRTILTDLVGVMKGQAPEQLLCKRLMVI